MFDVASYLTVAARLMSKCKFLVPMGEYVSCLSVFIFNVVQLQNIWWPGGEQRFGYNYRQLFEVHMLPMFNLWRVQFSDMSRVCVNNLETHLFLPYSMGVADAIVVIVSDNDIYPNCIINFITEKTISLIIVVEFPDHTEGTNNACQEANSNIFVGKYYRFH